MRLSFIEAEIGKALDEIKATTFIKSAIEDNIIESEAQLSDKDLTDAAFSHFLDWKEYEIITFQKREILLYCVRNGFDDLDDFLIQCKYYNTLVEMRTAMLDDKNSAKNNMSKPNKRGRRSNTLDDLILGTEDRKVRNKVEFCHGMMDRETNDAKAQYIRSQLNRLVTNWPTPNSVRQMLKNWRKQGLITMVDEKHFMKLS